MAAARPDVVVRPAREEDAAPAAAIVAQALEPKYRPAMGGAAARGIAALMRADMRGQRPSRHLVAEVDGRLAGAVHLMIGHAPPDPAMHDALAREVGSFTALRAAIVLGMLGHDRVADDEAYLDELAVAEWARRRGVARALVDACADLARREGSRRLTLWVTTDNAPARALYAAAGFREARRRRWIAGRLLFRAPGASLMSLPLAPG